MRIALIGAGALGSIYLDRLTRGLPQAGVVVLADGERADRLESAGVLVNGERRSWPVVRPGDDTEPADLLIIATKADGLTPAIELARPHVAAGTIILSLINGIHSEPVLAEAFPQADVLLSMTAGSDVSRIGNEVRFTNFGRIAFGAPQNRPPYASPVARLDALFTQAGVPHEVPADMEHVLWWKFMGNVGMNPASALLDATYGEFRGEDSPARAVMLALQREVVPIAAAHGVELTGEDTELWLRTIEALEPDGETSMLQDVRAARPTEIDIFAGEVVRQGRRLGIATPANALMLDAIRARERILARRSA